MGVAMIEAYTKVLSAKYEAEAQREAAKQAEEVKRIGELKKKLKHYKLK